MHQRMYPLRDKPVYDKEIFFDIEFRIQPFQIAGMIIFNTKTQYQNLSTGGRTDWVSLNKPKPVESAFQRRRPENTTRHGKPAQIIQRNHVQIG
jgi:hypothetical protein